MFTNPTSGRRLPIRRAPRATSITTSCCGNGIDAVVIATPDHQHYPCLQAALDAKKDVYLEKPMSHSLEESAKIVQAVRRTKQIVQVGMQRRSAEPVIKGKQLVDG